MIAPIYTAYLIVCSTLAFFLYATDKRKAKKGKWRVSEKTLLWVSFLGGGLGGILAMHLFRHKTKRWYFYAVNGFAVAWQIALFVYFLN